jgi:hypothetical protein
VKYCALALAAILLFFAPSAARAATVYAVFPIEDSSGRLDATSKKSLDDYLTARIGDIAGISIIPTAELRQKIQEQQAESYRACYDEACQIEIGKEAAANKSVATRIAAIGEDCLITSYVFDLARAATDATATERSKCDAQSLLQGLDKVVARFREVIARAQEAAGLSFGRLELSSDPTGAEIILDSARTGLWTPAELKSVPVGKHRVTIETDEAFAETTVDIAASKTASVALKLKPRPCLLAISTQPEGAKLFIGGKQVGVGPATIEVSPGLIEIIAKADDGRTGRATIFAKPARAPREISLQLGGGGIEEPPEEKGLAIHWLVTGGVFVGAGVAMDVIPESAHDHRLSPLDLVPLGLYTLAAVAAALGIIPAF